MKLVEAAVSNTSMGDQSNQQSGHVTTMVVTWPVMSHWWSHDLCCLMTTMVIMWLHLSCQLVTRVNIQAWEEWEGQHWRVWGGFFVFDHNGTANACIWEAQATEPVFIHRSDPISVQDAAHILKHIRSGSSPWCHSYPKVSFQQIYAIMYCIYLFIDNVLYLFIDNVLYLFIIWLIMYCIYLLIMYCTVFIYW